jgi:ribonuclease BN (tRNA processing enzyme)
LVVDGPGVIRGIAGAELLAALAEATTASVILLFDNADRHPLLASELSALRLPIIRISRSPDSRRPSKSARARQRTRLWNSYLDGAGVHTLDFESIAVLGTPPPAVATEQWRGRQAALVGDGGRTVALGEIESVGGPHLRLRCHEPPSSRMAMLVRDARRSDDGMLGSAGPDATDSVRYVAPADVLPDAQTPTGPRPVVRAGPITAALVNGVLGDPLLHVRLQHRRRSLLFDLGEAGRLPAKVVHQVSDVFLSHAHMDHIGGFVWLLRSRLGDLPAMRIFGPPGIGENVRGLLAGFLWDRIGDRGPRFEIAELDGDRLRRVALQGGGELNALSDRPAPNGRLLDEPELCVRAATLDHGHGTRVLAFALETPRRFNVRKEQLEASGLAPGPWLTEMKSRVAAEDRTTPIEVPDGRVMAAGNLADDLLVERPAVKLVYATDLADSERNRERLARLAGGAHTFFCEASFRLADADQARRTGHLTTRACAEIAERARVERLVPFHFSRRYQQDLPTAFDEVRAAFGRTLTPPARDDGE